MALGISIIAGHPRGIPALLVAADLYERRRSRQIAHWLTSLASRLARRTEPGWCSRDASDPVWLAHFHDAMTRASGTACDERDER